MEQVIHPDPGATYSDATLRGYNARMAHPSDDTLEQRQREAAAWAATKLRLPRVELRPVSGDASFRRYFRLWANGKTFILMDAPPEMEDSAAFVDIAGRLRRAGLNAPEIHHFDLRLGFGLLEDFGDTLYRELITEAAIDGLAPDLFDLLEGLARVDCSGLPEYSADRLQEEMNLLPEWYLDRHRHRPLRDPEQDAWDGLCATLIESAQNQPQVFVHKDFHSCNLLQTRRGPGVIDFQDAVRGPVSYDFVSLLWDRYIAWPRARLEAWMKAMRPRMAPQAAPAEWVRQCDWMGLQRNLKIVGIFARLHYRDGKCGYLEMIPRFYGYLLDVLARYPEFAAIRRLLEEDTCAP